MGSTFERTATKRRPENCSSAALAVAGSVAVDWLLLVAVLETANVGPADHFQFGP